MLAAGAGLPATGAPDVVGEETTAGIVPSGNGDVLGVGDAIGDSTCSAGKPCAMRRRARCASCVAPNEPPT